MTDLLHFVLDVTCKHTTVTMIYTLSSLLHHCSTVRIELLVISMNIFTGVQLVSKQVVVVVCSNLIKLTSSLVNLFPTAILEHMSVLLEANG